MIEILFILMPQGYQPKEFQVPYQAFLDKGYTVDVAGLAAGKAVAANGDAFTPNKQLSSMTNEEFDKYAAVVIPGGPGSEKYLWNNSNVQNTVKYFYNNKKIVAAICHACIALTKILAGKTATVFPSPQAKAEYQKANVTFVDKGCVTTDNKIVTAQGPSNAKEFAETIIGLLEGK